MDSLFHLNAEDRRLFLQNALSDLHGWMASRGLHAAKRFVSSVPGLAFKRGLPYIELESSALVNLASALGQRQFYKEARIKVGGILFSNSSFSAQEPLPIDWSRPSSSSSSFPSLSIESPEYSSFTDPPGVNFMKATIPQSQQRTVDAYRCLQLPSHQHEDEVLTRAMLAVISSQPIDNQRRMEGIPISHINSSAFKAYDSNTGASFDSQARFVGQKMLKKAITISRKIHSLNYRYGRGRGLRPANVQQLQHMMSERKRREKLGESIHMLRRLIPLGSKVPSCSFLLHKLHRKNITVAISKQKDKLSVLLKAREYLETLKAQVHELQEKNNKLEMQLQPSKKGTAEKIRFSREMLEIQVNKASESTSESARINLAVIIRARVNLADLVLTVLECLKGMAISNMISVDASAYPPQEIAVSWTNLTLQFEANNTDENTLKEAVTQAIISLFSPAAA
ncbi:hypothetical protein HPP92_021282 [Vanilla planifolia]|uniref:BHLH domain-containing protein n=1 Tax=Vanilla planifolia TaxID=51239 RepID=A0A835UKK4_VANPL|nr:hypothetical protein HPP92_021282 [Vanilla planifolia]